MAKVVFPYGRGKVEHEFPASRFLGTLIPRFQSVEGGESQEDLIREAFNQPEGSPRLRELAKNKKNIVIIASDHTRPVPSRLIIPPMLAEIREGNPEADITILVATGCHRGTTKDELIEKFGPEITQREKIVIHDCDESDFARLGKLPSGGELIINRIAAEADLLVSEGFIEPHFFAGFSGGRKSVLPGIASRVTVLYNHNSEFIAHPCARTGVLDHNPIHADMLHAAKEAKLMFICNVVINAKKEVIFAAAGNPEAAHKKGCDYLAGLSGVKAKPADIVVTTNGGYPLDQNIYQAVKGMTAAEATVREGGVIIILAASNDGHGGEEFYRTFLDGGSLDELEASFMRTPRDKTRVDQWESQILVRVLKKASVIYISEAEDELVKAMRLLPAHSLSEAMEMAENILKSKSATITAIPDGVSTIVLP